VLADLLQKLDLAGPDPILTVEIDAKAQLGQGFAPARHDGLS